MGGISLGKLVEHVKSFCGHILEHKILNLDPGKEIQVQFTALDRNLVVRTDQFKVVAGWYTWLALDMGYALLISESGYTALNENFELDFLKTYRYPNVIVRAWFESHDGDRCWLNAELTLDNGTVLARSRAKMKLFQLEKKND